MTDSDHRPPPPRSVPPRDGRSKKVRRLASLAWLVAGVVLVGLALNFPGDGARQVPFSRFLQLTDEGRVAKATIGQQTVEAELKGSGNQPGENVRSALPTEYQTNDLVERLRRSGAEVDARPPSPWSAALVGLLPFLLIGLFWYFVVLRRARQQLGGSPMSFGRHRAKLYDRADMKTTFADVAGVDEVEAELTELVDYLRKPEKYERIGARIPKGVLLVGPPGTGKTLLARAIAGEADVPFFYISASEFIELFVGLGAARMRDLFEQARQRAPAIVFIDEIDAIGQTRAGGAGFGMAGHQEQEQTLQQLLTEMDGFAPNTGVIIVAASNRPEVLDPALLRPGRFDRQIQVNLPDIRGRRDILVIHARGVNLEPDVDLGMVARRTPGFSGAMLANVINEAALLAGRRGKDRVGRSEIEEAIDRVIAGLERRSQVLSEQERRIVAYHELGHAVVAHLVEHADPVHRVSIIPRGIGALGHTQQLPEEERYLMSEPELRDRIAVLLGGRAAEEVVFGFPTTGAEDDLRKATEIARRMVTEFGMSRKLGPINITEEQSRFLSPLARRGDDVSDHTETVIDSEVRSILTEAHEKAGQVLLRVRMELDLLADLLLERETLERSDLEKHLGTRPSARPAEDQDSDETPTVGRAAG